jgi:hypothetical protein
MAESARARRVGIPAAALLLGLLAGCGGSPPVDMYFGTNVGADFRAPVTDASADGATNVTPDSGAAGATGQGGGGATGQGGGGATGQGGGGAAGQDGMAGATGQATGQGGMAGAAGQSGTNAAQGG